MEAEDIPAACLRLQEVREAGLDPRGLVAEWQRTARSRDSCWDTFTIFLGLDFDTDQRRAFLLSLNNTDRLAIRKEQGVCLAETVPERKFADCYSSGGIQVRLEPILHDPPGSGQKLIDCLSELVLLAWSRQSFNSYRIDRPILHLMTLSSKKPNQSSAIFFSLSKSADLLGWCISSNRYSNSANIPR